MSRLREAFEKGRTASTGRGVRQQRADARAPIRRVPKDWDFDLNPGESSQAAASAFEDVEPLAPVDLAGSGRPDDRSSEEREVARRAGPCHRTAAAAGRFLVDLSVRPERHRQGGRRARRRVDAGRAVSAAWGRAASSPAAIRRANPDGDERGGGRGQDADRHEPRADPQPFVSAPRAAGRRRPEAAEHSRHPAAAEHDGVERQPSSSRKGRPAVSHHRAELVRADRRTGRFGSDGRLWCRTR